MIFSLSKIFDNLKASF